MSSKDFRYGVLLQNVLMNQYYERRKSPRTALLGQIVIIDKEKDSEYAVRFLTDGNWDTTTFSCSKDSVVIVNEKVWPFLSSISSPRDRVKLAKNKEKCDRLMSLSQDSVVGFTDTNDVLLGRVKFIGEVKSIGKAFGIELHEQKKNNQCNGSCAGIQYFTCKPGKGLFTTIEKIQPVNYQQESPPSPHTTTRDTTISCFNNLDKDLTPQYEEIVTKYGEYTNNQKRSNAMQKYSSNLRNSMSLQNMLEVEGLSVNTNNDYDQNTILQPDKTYLINDMQNKPKVKSEMDLIEVIGNSWSGATDKNKLDDYSKLKKSLDRNDNFKDKEERGKGKSSYFVSHLNNDAGGTLNRKSRFYTGDLGESGTTSLKRKNPKKEESKKINEKSEQLTTAGKSTFYLPQYTDPPPGSTGDITLGTLVEVLNDVSDGVPLYGVVRWMGIENGTGYVLVGVELEEEQSHLPLDLTDGVHKGERFFRCAEKRGLFVPLQQCRKDSRFQDGTPTPVHQASEQVIDCPAIPGAVAPLCMPTEEDVEAVCAKYRGIQGHHNSCYLDVTLFAMFTYTSVFDSLLFRPKNHNDIDDYEEVQKVLREEIVNPLRKNLFVSADRVMKLRKLLDKLSSVSGLTSEEKDPEEFLNSLLAQILKAEPFLKLNSGQEAFHYQLFVEKNHDLTLPTVQQLFDQSFLTSNIKLKEVPSCLIIQMPRFGKSYKVYPRILPSLLLDVTDVIEGSPRQCIVCGKLAKYECRDCFDDAGTAGLESTGFCSDCVRTVHKHERRQQHHPVRLQVAHDFAIMEDHCRPPRLFMELFAVICIETSHYVAFVKCGVGHEAPWCFFDSMADRKGERNGYNIPEMVACPDISRWLSDDTVCRKLHEDFEMDRHLPEHARRLLCDAYICMYQSSDVMMYR